MLDPEVLRVDAERYHGIYGSYGISVFAVRDATLEELAQQTPLVVWTEGGEVMTTEIDLIADLNAEDDEGLGWSVLGDARDPSRVRAGAMLVAGNSHAAAVVRVVSVDEDGQVHFTILPGSLEKNRHLIGRALA